MKRRVVITGMGAVTPIGNTLDEFWNGIKEEKVGIGAITKFDTEDYKVKIAAEVKDFNVKERLDNKAARRMEVFSQYAVAASREAFAMAGLDMEKEDPYRVGVINHYKGTKESESNAYSFNDFQHGSRKCSD